MVPIRIPMRQADLIPMQVAEQPAKKKIKIIKNMVQIEA